MSDIYEIDRWTDTEGHAPNEYGDYEWPYPDEIVVSQVTGSLREQVLARTGHDGRAEDVRIYERTISGGYSEYTQENDYEFEVRVDDEVVWKTESYWIEGSLPKFLAWLDEGPAR